MKLEYEKLLYNIKFELFGKTLKTERQSFESFLRLTFNCFGKSIEETLLYEADYYLIICLVTD